MPLQNMSARTSRLVARALSAAEHHNVMPRMPVIQAARIIDWVPAIPDFEFGPSNRVPSKAFVHQRRAQHQRWLPTTTKPYQKVSQQTPASAQGWPSGQIRQFSIVPNQNETVEAAQIQEMLEASQPDILHEWSQAPPIKAQPEPVPAPLTDERRAAIPLKSDVLAQLPPTMKKFTLAGKVAIVTGGARGLGFNMTQALVEAGASGIALMDVNETLGRVAAKELADQTGVDVRFFKLDVRDEHAIAAEVSNAFDHFGHIDVLVSSAGIADSNLPAETYPLTSFRRTLDINLTGTFLIAQKVAQQLISTARPGSLIFIASMSGSIVNYPQEQCAYNASKAGVVHLARSLAAEWAKHGIRVNAISPGYHDTALNRVGELEAQKRIWKERTPMGRLGKIDDINGAAVWLASEGSGFVTGVDLKVDGGYVLW